MGELIYFKTCGVQFANRISPEESEYYVSIPNKVLYTSQVNITGSVCSANENTEHLVTALGSR